MRAVLEAAGVHDVLSQVARFVQRDQHRPRDRGSPKLLESPEMVAARRGLTVEEVAPAALLRAGKEGIAEAKAKAEAGVGA